MGVPRFRRLAWIAWALALALAGWGLTDAPNRGDVGLLLRGSQVGSVEPGRAAARAGLHPGERVRSPGGTATELRRRLARLRPGESIAIERGVSPSSVVTLVGETPGPDTIAWRLAWGLVALGFLLLGAAVARRRADEVGLLFFLWCIANGFALAPRPSWPTALGAAAHDAVSSAAPLLLPALLVHFFALFPEGRGRRRTAVAIGLYVAAGLLLVGAPAVSAWWPRLTGVTLALGAMGFAGGCVSALVSFALSYRASGPRHRRRLNVLLWSSALGLLPLVAATVSSNLGSPPGGAALRAAALSVLLVPAGFAYAIEVHQVLDFRWRRNGGEPRGPEQVPVSPPVFAWTDARSTVDAVAGDLHSRLGLAHCAAYRVDNGAGARLVTWLGDVPADPVPGALPIDLTRALDHLTRPVDLEELAKALESGPSHAVLAELRRAGSRVLLPLFSSGKLTAVLALGPRLSGDLAAPRQRAALSEYAAHASLAVEHADVLGERASQAQVSRELEVARGIQEHLLPERDPSFPTLACAGASIPSGRVGGDYYDYLPLGRRRFGVAVGDVCGKGIPAALLVAHVQAALRRQADGARRPAEVLAALNQELASYHQAEKFVCLSYAMVDSRSRTVTWAGGGLHPPLWVRPDQGVDALSTGDLILGVDPETRYREYTVQLAPMESLVFLTDGILDARRGAEDFGSSRLFHCLARSARLRPPRLCDRLLAEARAFHSTGIADDMTAVVLQAR